MVREELAGRWGSPRTPLTQATGLLQEAKLEIPFLALPGSSTPVTLKHTLLFSSVMMAVSGRFVTGLRAHRGVFLQGETHTEGVEGWMEVREEQAAGEEEERGWSEDALREVLTGWWVGEKSGGTATRVSYISFQRCEFLILTGNPYCQFHFTSVQPPRRRPSLKVRLHLPSLLGQSLDATLELIKEIDDHSGKKKLAVDEQGWLELRASGWSLSEATSMEARTVSSL